MHSPELVEQLIREFLREVKDVETYDLDTPLDARGIGLDSLETAELSVTLEDVLGTDPWSTGKMPQSIREILEFYREIVSTT